MSDEIADEQTRRTLTPMKIKAYALYKQSAPLQPATGTRHWLQANEPLADELAAASVNRQGWELLCPFACEATWNGGPDPEGRITTSLAYLERYA